MGSGLSVGNDLSLAAWKRVARTVPSELQGYAREWAQARERLELDPCDHMAHLEWELWLSLVEALEESGAVTKEDRKAPVSDTSTPGRKLFKALRDWGDQRAASAKARGES